jgi:hypothetical protein
MNWKRFLIVFFLFAAILFFGIEIFFVIRETKVLMAKNQNLKEQLDKLSLEKDKISEDLKYYANPLNLQKLIREKFNYKFPGEKMIIVVPSNQ